MQTNRKKLMLGVCMGFILSILVVGLTFQLDMEQRVREAGLRTQMAGNQMYPQATSSHISYPYSNIVSLTSDRSGVLAVLSVLMLSLLLSFAFYLAVKRMKKER